MPSQPRQTDCPTCGGTGKLGVRESLQVKVHRLLREKAWADIECSVICGMRGVTAVEKQAAIAARVAAAKEYHIWDDLLQEKGE